MKLILRSLAVLIIAGYFVAGCSRLKPIGIYDDDVREYFTGRNEGLWVTVVDSCNGETLPGVYVASDNEDEIMADHTGSVYLSRKPQEIHIRFVAWESRTYRVTRPEADSVVIPIAPRLVNEGQLPCPR